MKTRIAAFAIVGALAILCGCRPAAKTYDDMSPEERLNYLRSQTANAALVESTNEVPGIRAIVQTDVDDLGDSIVKWNGIVRLDYMNSVGGIDRTNLHLKFTAGSEGKVFAAEDSAYYEAQWQAHLADLKRRAGLIPPDSSAGAK